MAEIRVRVWRVGRRSESEYLLVLRDDLGNPLVMVIGPCEAISIWTMLRPADSPRVLHAPRTHDLMRDMVERLGGRVQRVVIDDLWGGVYYAKLHLAANGATQVVDARPSDAVALALRFDAPLFVTDAVMAAGAEPEAPPSAPSSDLDDLL
jgi:bifunctional DNase/RNase